MLAGTSEADDFEYIVAKGNFSYNGQFLLLRQGFEFIQ